MDVADLKVFEAVARLGGMNKAAIELNTVQSNVTARIRALEQRLGVTVFERTSRGVALTPARDEGCCHTRFALGNYWKTQSGQPSTMVRPRALC